MPQNKVVRALRLYFSTTTERKIFWKKISFGIFFSLQQGSTSTCLRGLMELWLSDLTLQFPVMMTRALWILLSRWENVMLCSQAGQLLNHLYSAFMWSLVCWLLLNVPAPTVNILQALLWWGCLVRCCIISTLCVDLLMFICFLILLELGINLAWG